MLAGHNRSFTPTSRLIHVKIKPATCTHMGKGLGMGSIRSGLGWEVAGGAYAFFFFFFSTEGSPQPGSGADRARDRTK